MRSVRCDACGTKALIAASQCPKCNHLFDVRDGFGKLLPLAYCSACESYYAARVGECKWCGTKPEPEPRAPKMWKPIGAGALVALAWLGWMLRDPHPKPATQTKAPPQPTAQATNVSDSVAPAIPTVAEVPVDAAAPVVTASDGNVERAPAPPPSAIERATPDVVRPRTTTRWVNSVARSWIVVRADARRSSRIVASIGPDSRVQLGESRDGWRHIRSRAIVGWVEEAHASFSVVSSSARANRLADRH